MKTLQEHVEAVRNDRYADEEEKGKVEDNKILQIIEIMTARTHKIDEWMYKAHIQTSILSCSASFHIRF